MFKLLKKDWIIFNWGIPILLIGYLPVIMGNLRYLLPLIPIDVVCLYCWIVIFVGYTVKDNAKTRLIIPSLPIPRRQIVNAKYLILIITFVVTICLYYLVTMIFNWSTPNITFTPLDFTNISIAYIYSFSVVLLVLPFKFMGIKDEIFIYLFFIFLLPMLMIHTNDMAIPFTNWRISNNFGFPNSMSIVLTDLIVVCLTILSYFLSVWLYKRREFR